MEFPLTSLPNEVLCMVFSHLEMKERLKACLVCKKWLELMNCKSLLCDITLCLEGDSIQHFSPMTRNFFNFYLSDIIFDDNCEELVRHLDLHAEHIEMMECKMNRNEIIRFDVSLKNLIVLDVTNCDSWSVFPIYPNLSELHLFGKDTIADDGIAILQKTMKRLKILTLSCSIVFDHKIYRRFYPPGLTFEKNPSSAVLSFLAIKSFISERVNTLCELDLSANRLTASALKELSCIKGLNLNKISLDNLFDCSKSLIDLFENQPNLKVLNLEEGKLNDRIITSLCAFLPNIEELKISACKISDKSLKDIFSLNQIKKLDISFCIGQSSSGFHEAICNFKPAQIKHLNLCKIAVPMSSAPFFKHLKHLVDLNLNGCDVTDSHVHVISTFLEHLRILNLSKSNITNCSLTGSSAAEENQNTPPIDENPTYKAIYNLRFLKQLSLNFCSKLTDDCLISTIKFLFLESLFLRGINISGNSITILYSLNPKLKYISWDD